MDFFNRLLKPAFALFGCHVGGVVLSFIIVACTSSITSNPIANIVVGIIVLLVYSIPTYSNMWLLGNTDLNKQNFNHIKKDIFKGFKIGAISSIPAFVMAILMILSKFGLFDNFIFIFKVLNSELVPWINMINMSPYLTEYSVLEIVLIASLTLIPSIIAGLFYMLGNKDISPINNMIYSKNKKDSNS